MGFIKRILGIEHKAAPAMRTLDEASFWEFFGASMPTASGASVTPETAMRVPAVRGAVSLIAESLATCLWALHRRVGDGLEQDTAHPLARMFQDGPNDWTSWPEFVAALAADALQRGRGYAMATRAADGRLLELHHLPAGFVGREQATPLDEPIYRVSLANGQQLNLRRADVLEVSALAGRSPIRDGREAIGLAMGLEGHAAALIGRGARPAAVLERDNPSGAGDKAPVVTPTQDKERETRFNAAFGGVENSAKTVMLPPGTRLKPLTFNSVDLQFSEMRKFQVEEIARIFRVPPTLLQHLDKASLNNTTELAAQFGKFCLSFYVTIFEAALRLTCLTEDERDKYVIEGDMSELMKADMAGRFAAYAAGMSSGVLAANEPRRWENLPPKAGGDELRAPLNTAPTAGGADAGK